LESLEEISEREEPRVLVPEGYAPTVKEFGAYVVLEIAPDCSLSTFPGDIVIVENGMVREINFEGETYTIILENYVCGCLSDEGGGE
jgi:co-chaperonin GroES (HSP10)